MQVWALWALLGLLVTRPCLLAVAANSAQAAPPAED
jgi:hypothetical protein